VLSWRGCSLRWRLCRDGFGYGCVYLGAGVFRCEGGVLVTDIEVLRAAARGRRPLDLRDLHLLCQRCDTHFRARRIERECLDCQRIGIKVYGTSHPRMNMAGM
jgi:hypothetical protein